MKDNTTAAVSEPPETIEVSADSHDRMLRTLRRIRDQHLYERLAFGSESVSDREERLRTASLAAHQAVLALGELAKRRLWLSDTRKALEHLLAASLLVESSGATASALEAAVSAKLGLAWLRLAENENCVDCNNAASCLLPISADGVHRLQEGSRAAIDALSHAVAIQPDDATSRWLLNVAAMTLGGYPDTVPEAHRVDPQRFQSEEAFPRFTNVALDRGVNTVSRSGGSVVDDFDGDGDLDLFVGNEDAPCQPFANDSGSQFHEVGRTSGVAINAFVKGVAAGDYDNDGFPDLYISVLGGPNRLFHNNGDGTFTDVAPRLGVTGPRDSFPTWFWDANQDGHLDIFVSGYSIGLEGIAATYFDGPAAPLSHLYEGDGNGSFTDVAHDRNLNNRLAEMGGAFPGDRAANCLFENPGFGNHSVTIQLVGHRSNRSAIGARIAAEILDGNVMRTVYHWVGSGGSFGANPLRCEIGIGKAISIQRLEISWPASGLTQVYHDVPADGFFRIDEGDDVLHPLLGST